MSLRLSALSPCGGRGAVPAGAPARATAGAVGGEFRHAQRCNGGGGAGSRLQGARVRATRRDGGTCGWGSPGLGMGLRAGTERTHGYGQQGGVEARLVRGRGPGATPRVSLLVVLIDSTFQVSAR